MHLIPIPSNMQFQKAVYEFNIAFASYFLEYTKHTIR